MSDIEDGFVYTDNSKSAAEAIAKQPFGREITLVKAAIQSYISKWLLPDTWHNSLLMWHSPHLSRYVQSRDGARNIYFNVDQSWEEVDDTNTRRVQIARFTERINRSLPSILIVDGGYVNKVAGLGDIQASRVISGHMVNFDVATSLLISLDIIILAEDDTTCNDLCMFVTSVLGSPLRRLGGGNHIYNPDQHIDGSGWQITLPLENNVGALSRENINDDPINSIWTASLTIEIMYDGVKTLTSGVPVKRGMTNINEEGGSIISYVPQSNSLLTDVLSIDGPSNVRVGQPTSYRLLADNTAQIYTDPSWTLSVSDYRIAVLDTNMVLHPRRYGTIYIRVFKADVLIAEKEITVT